MKLREISRIVLLTVMLLLNAVVYAQGPFFKSIDLPNRFDDINIELTAQCRDGFIWIGTDKGLYRYDGLELTEIILPDEGADNDITAISSVNSDSIWIGYRSGQIALLTANGFHVFTPPEGNPKQKITDIVRDRRGNTWYATYGEGIYIFDGNRIYNIAMEDGLADNYIYCLEVAPDGLVWAGSDKGINICGFDDGAKTVEHIGSRQGLPDNIVTSLQSDGDALIFAGMYKDGICAIDQASRDITNLFQPGEWNYGEVKAFVFQNDELWITTEKREIIQYVMSKPSYVRHYDQLHNLPEAGFKHIANDDEGNLWIVSSNSNLTKVNLLFEIIDQHEDLDFNNIRALLADRSGYLWFFNGQGLIRHSIEFTGRNTVRQYQLPLGPNMQIISLYEDDLGFIWAGTFGNGAYRIDTKTGAFMHVDMEHGLVDDNILCISGTQDNIWFATLGGVSHIRSGAITTGKKLVFDTINEEDGLVNNYVYSVYTDNRGSTWFATDGNGMVEYTDGTFTSYSPKTGHIKSPVVYSITGDEDGNIWFSTLKEGIYKYDGSNFQNYNTSNGLTDPNITSLVTDGKNNLVIAHRKGVDILNTRTGKFSYYSEEYGLNDINPDLNTASMDVNGDIWLGTRKALIKYTMPDTLARKQPRTILDNPAVFLEPFNFNKSRTLRAHQNHLTFNFRGLWFQNPEAVTYQYQLKGYDPDWVTTKNNSVIYPNLPHGTYTFSVRSSADQSFDNTGIQHFAFFVHPPFWKTWWFILISVLAFTAILYYLFYTRERRVKKRERREKERVLLEFENLKSQVNPHFLFNSFNSLINVIEDDQEKAVEYVEKLSQFFRNILMYRDEELISLEDELKIVEDYFFIHRQRYDSLVSLDINVGEFDLKKLIPPLTLQILIENAIKHNVISKAHPLNISIDSDANHIAVRNKIVPKRTKEASTGTGLQNVRNRYRLLTDQPLSITEGPGEFIVVVPLINNES